MDKKKVKKVKKPKDSVKVTPSPSKAIRIPKKVSVPKKKAIKPKKETVEDKYDDEIEKDFADSILDEIFRIFYLNNNKGIYLSIASTKQYIVVAKRIELAVKANPGLNIFQPHEELIPKLKEFCVLAILKWDYCDSQYLDDLQSIGCPVYRIKYVENVMSTLEGIGK